MLTAVRLSIRPGQFVGLLGASGAGKSTLLKCLAGYLPPAPGSSLRIDDLEIPRDLASYLPLIGYVPQEDVLFPGLTVTENLDYALRLRAPDLGPVERNGLIRSVLQQVGVDDTAERLVATIAPGERKRVSVAQELLTRPRALFLDEPTTGLDPAHETQVMTYMRRLAQQGMTVVCATHVMENLKLFDRVLVIARGRVAYDGAPSELLSTFRVRSYPDLYVQLEYESVVDKDSGNGLPGIASKSSVPVARLNAPPRSLRLSHQIAVQVLRGTKLIRRDVALLLLLLGQPVAIGLLIALSQMSNSEDTAFITFAAVTAVWLGLNNAAREVVRDRRIYIREKLLGVTPEGFLVAKVLLYAMFGLGQIMLLCAVLYAGTRIVPGLERKLADWSFREHKLVDWNPIGVIAVLWITYLGGELLGLFVSTMSKTQEAAIAVLPLVVLPQLLLS